MNSQKLIFKIRLLFLFMVLFLSAIFFFYGEYEVKKRSKEVSIKYENISNYLRQNRMRMYSVIEYIESLNFKVEKEHEKILSKALIIDQKRGFEVLYLNSEYYLHILTPHFKVLFKDLKFYEKSDLSYLVFILIFMLLVFIYLLIIKNIKDTALLLDSRQLFLRTVMHELKTPIAKGRIVSELIKDGRQRDRMVNIFDKLNFLINDFAKIEQVVSKNYKADMYKNDLHTILRVSIDMLMLDTVNDKIKMEGIDFKKVLEVDMDLISLAIKNILDNGIKYSSNNKVVINQNGNMLLFISKGEKLQKPLDEYFKPFHNDTKEKNHGMGLGLYIVDSILKIHGYSLKYEYKEDHNIFKIAF